MLKFLRKRQRSIWIVAAFAIIIIVFIFWGIGTLRVDDTGIAARVNGQVITAKEFAKVYQRQIEFYRNTLKDQFSEELLERLNLKERILEGIINRAVLLQEAKRQRLKVTKEELQKAIQAIPQFQRNGVFDRELYFTLLNRNRISPGEFEKDIEDNLLLDKMQKKLTQTIKVSDREVLDAYNVESKRMNLLYLTIDTTRFERDIVITDEEAKGYFDKNSDTFKVPTMVKAVYVSLSPKEFASRIKVSQEEIRNYYEKSIKEFQTPKRVKARHILIRPSSNNQEDIEKAHKQAEEILKMARNGGDFSKLAEKYSQDPASGAAGGDLGYFGPGEMVKPFEEAAFALKRGEISPIVKSQFGFHIIKVEDIKEAGLIPLKEARGKIQDKLQNKEGTRMARELAQTIHNEIAQGKDIADVTLMHDLKTKETGLFSADDTKTELTRDEEVKKVVFALKKDETGAPVETFYGIYIIKVVDRKEEHLPPYGEAAIGVKKFLKKERAR
ncbi:MAG: SurA N-terminal domain-containing protein, partial [Deltaproteobacteria bacterium]|nr:SurA N-terminal domain-containing protein [Deltaproteobacteria bacterium]